MLDSRDSLCSPETIAEEAYARAIQYFEQELSTDPKKVEWVKNQQNSIASVVEVVEKARLLYSTKQGHGHEKARRWINVLASRVTYYGQVLDILAQHHPEYVALAWGAIKFVMMVSLQSLVASHAFFYLHNCLFYFRQGVINHSEMIVKLSKALSRISEALPLIKLGIDLYPTEYMKEAVSRVYAHIMLFLQKAAKWYTMGSARRVLSSVGNPFTLSYEDTVEQIRSCTEYVNVVADAGSRAETRGLTIMLEQQDRTLQQMRELLSNITQKAHEREGQIAQLLQIATFTKPIIQDTYIEVGNQGNLIREMYSADVLCILKPLRAPEDVLFTSQSIANRRKLWKQPTQDSVPYIRALDQWASIPGSSLFLIQAGPGAETRTKDLAVEVAARLKNNAHEIVWYISERLNDNQNYGLVDVLKVLIFQLFQKYPEILKSSPEYFATTKLQSQHSEQEWTDLFQFVLTKVPRCFIIVESESIYGRKDRSSSWSTTLSAIFKQAIANAERESHILKVLLVTYGSVYTPATEGIDSKLVEAYIRSAPVNLQRARRGIGRQQRLFTERKLGPSFGKSQLQSGMRASKD